MEFTYYGHSCFNLKINGLNLLFDPFITPNELAKSINVKEIQADFILASHGHEDHVADVETIAKRTGAKLIGSWELTNWFAESGIKHALFVD
jgi:L-ascorbate metabolism protein UlaG (beta-lactamase superfamily)